jgi:hypothetical protein
MIHPHYGTELPRRQPARHPLGSSSAERQSHRPVESPYGSRVNLTYVDTTIAANPSRASLPGMDKLAAGADAALGEGDGTSFSERYSTDLGRQRAMDEGDRLMNPATRYAEEGAGLETALVLPGVNVVREGARARPRPMPQQAAHSAARPPVRSRATAGWPTRLQQDCEAARSEA